MHRQTERQTDRPTDRQTHIYESMKQDKRIENQRTEEKRES